MAIMILARHAQASFGSSNYDQLSELGRTQAKWLGEYFAERELKFKSVWCGTLERQRDTASGVLQAMGVTDLAVMEDAGLNEYHAEPIVRAFANGVDPIELQNTDYKKYWQLFRQAMAAWAADELVDPPETWNAFGDRMTRALSAATANTERDDVILVVSSGGAIARGLSDLLGVPAATAIELNLQFRNTAFCELIVSRSGMRLIGMNNIPHLDRPGRRDSITAA